MTYIVIELQTAANGAVGNFLFTYTDRYEAEAKYHLILAAAATSSVPVHTAVIMTNEGQLLERKSYHHAAAEPEVEPEAE